LHDQTASMFRGVLAQGVTVPDLIVEGQTPKKPGVTWAWRVSSFPVLGAANQPGGMGTIVKEVTD